MMYGWIGQTLRIDLKSGKIKKNTLNPELARDFIGGRGLASKLLYDEIDPTIDPLSPKNKLIFVTGPLTGTYAPSSGRYMVVTKAPLTGTIGSSNSGGYFGPELKYAGYDLIIFEGKSKKPVYLWIDDAEVELRSAEHLWGKNTYETEDLIKGETDEDARVACIGQAGEKLIKFACVMNDKHRGAGRSGVGAVMGSKNLKAIAVKGTGSVKVADKDCFRKATLDCYEKIKANPVTGKGLPRWGTPMLVNVINAHGIFPTKNFLFGVFEGVDKISGETLADKILIRNRGCFGCPIGCGRVTEVTDPKFKGKGEGPEYESIWSLGADCGVDDLGAISKANYICNEMGMDTISVGGTIACTMELSEKGYLPTEDIGLGRKLCFGDAEAIVELTKKAGNRDGFGNILAEGSFRLAEKYGYPELSMGVKKQEFPAYDPRGVQGMALEYATSNRGACHVRGYMISPEIVGLPLPVDRFETEGKADLLKTFQDLTAVVDSSGICLFTTFAIGIAEIRALLKSATGIDYTAESLMIAGDRIWNLERFFNLKAGFTSKDDTLPQRLLKEPMPEGPSKGHVAMLGEMLPEYYKVRGWDENGIPSEAKLKELGLEK
jgi:aldehyde:ferredoxin oxidoreductase